MGGKSTVKSETYTNPQALAQYQSAVATLPKVISPVSGEQIARYQSPYQSQVIDAFQRSNEQARQLARNSNTDQAIAQHAFGGTGLAVENALTNSQYDQNSGSFTSNLLNSGYGQALATAQAENDKQNQYPIAIQQLLGTLAQGTTNTTRTQVPYDWGNTIKAVGQTAQTAGSIAAMFSDVRLKTDIVPLGSHRGRNWYSYRYLWSPDRHVGVMAQENPDIAIEGPNGFLMVNYGAL